MMLEEDIGAPLLAARDASRAHVSTSMAAQLLHCSRYHAANLIKTGQIEGFGVPSATRTRWFAYLDKLPAGGSDAISVASADPQFMSELRSVLLDARDLARQADSAIGRASRALLDAADTLNQGIRDVTEGADPSRVLAALTSVNDSRCDAERQLLLAVETRRQADSSLDRTINELLNAVERAGATS